MYIIHSDVINYIIQEELGKGRAIWITRIMEYDMKIKPTKLMRGRDLYENITEVVHMISIIKDDELTNEKNYWIK